MIQGTASHVGKTVIAAGLCRVFARKGFSVAPFKSQNMSLNSFVTKDGSEIGRAQAMQAQAAGTEPLADMNPILLKPLKDDGSQVVVLGKPSGNMTFTEYMEFRPQALSVVKGSLERLMKKFDLIVVEGAGGAAEVNFSRTEIVNMAIAKLADAPVLLVGDIDRGGVFASLVGTLELLERSERERVRGLIINKFRGDRSLLDDGIGFLEKKTGKPVVGVVPHIDRFFIDDEDSVSLENFTPESTGGDVKVCVPRFPRISNFTDLRPLEMEDGVSVLYAQRPSELEDADALVLAGSKVTIADLRFLKESAMAEKISEMCERGVPVVAVCGGYQMLGSLLADENALESERVLEEGLGIFPLKTEIKEKKILRQTSAVIKSGGKVFAEIEGGEVSGYEIRMGQTRFFGESSNGVRSFLEKRDGSFDGMVSEGGNVYGTYLHGIFENDNFRRAFLGYLRKNRGLPDKEVTNFAPEMEKQYDRLADCLEENLNIDVILDLVHR